MLGRERLDFLYRLTHKCHGTTVGKLLMKRLHVINPWQSYFDFHSVRACREPKPRPQKSRYDVDLGLLSTALGNKRFFHYFRTKFSACALKTFAARRTGLTDWLYHFRNTLFAQRNSHMPKRHVTVGKRFRQGQLVERLALTLSVLSSMHGSEDYNF